MVAGMRLAASLAAKRNFRHETEVLPRPPNWPDHQGRRLTIRSMEKKIFWGSMTVLGLLADVVLPLWWGLAATIPIVFFSWWIAYRSGWFE